MTNPTLIGPTKMARVLRSAQAAGTAGVLIETLAELHPDIPSTSIFSALSMLRQRGQVAAITDPAPWPAHRRQRYYAIEHAPDDWQARAPKPRAKPGATAHPYRGPVRGHFRARLEHDQPTIVPPGVRVQVCPSGQDFRHTLRPGEPVQGCGFVAKWKRLRRQRRPAQRKEAATSC